MRRFALAMAVTFGLFGAASPAAQGADPCPNAQYRTGDEAGLPDCRAWEQVTPPAKGGYSPTQSSGSPSSGAAAPGGGRVFFTSRADAGNADALPFGATFASTRGSSWSTGGIDAPNEFPPPAVGIFNTPTYGISTDGSKALVTSIRKLTPEATEGATNVYVRDLSDRSLRFLITVPGVEFSFSAYPFLGGTSDFRYVVLSLPGGVVPGDADGGLYRLGDGQLTKVGVDTAGNSVPIGGPAPSWKSPAHPPISEDGRRVTFARPSFQGAAALYQRVDGSSTVLLSRSHVPGTQTDEPVDVTSSGGWASADGRRVIFAVTDPARKLTQDGPGPFYRWDAEGDELTSLLDGVTLQMGPQAGGFEIRRVSPDGRYVWFTYEDGSSSGRLSFLSVLDTSTRTISTKARFEGNDATYAFSESSLDFSADGTKAVGKTVASLTGYDQKSDQCVPNVFGDQLCEEAFAFDAKQPGAAPVCVSCGPPGTHSVAQVGLGIADSNAVLARPTPVTNDGRVFFDTPQRLSPADVNAVRDIYQYTPGRGTVPIAGGTNGTPTSLVSTTPSGNDVFFLADDRLVAQDDDTDSDVYDARVGGGIAAQRVSRTVGPSCPTGDCPGSRAPSPAAEIPGTATFQGPRGAPRFSVSTLSRAAKRAAVASGRLKVTATVGDAGRLSARASARIGKRAVVIGRTSVTARRAGRVTITLTLSRSARRALAREGKLAASLSVTYSRAAKPANQSFTLTASRARSSKKGGAR